MPAGGRNGLSTGTRPIHRDKGRTDRCLVSAIVAEMAQPVPNRPRLAACPVTAGHLRNTPWTFLPDCIGQVQGVFGAPPASRRAGCNRPSGTHRGTGAIVTRALGRPETDVRAFRFLAPGTSATLLKFRVRHPDQYRPVASGPDDKPGEWCLFRTVCRHFAHQEDMT